jgi:hypothetical protein
MDDHSEAPQAPKTPLTEVLLALGEEFMALGAFTDEFQSSLSPALLRVANDAECHRNVQTLDLLSQRLTALSKYVLTIRQVVPDDLLVDPQKALRNISLTQLAYRLNGSPVPDEIKDVSGELDLF